MGILGDKDIPIFGKYKTRPQPKQQAESAPEPKPEPPRVPEVVVKEYRGKKKYEKEARKMVEHGWQIVSVNQRNPSSIAKFFYGFLVQPHYTVTYQR